MIRYVYDPQTFRLARLRSEATHGQPAPPAQDYGYAYDLVGNLLFPARPHARQRDLPHPRTSSTAPSVTTRCTSSPPPPAGNATSRRPRPGSTPPAAPTSPRSARTPRRTPTTTVGGLLRLGAPAPAPAASPAATTSPPGGNQVSAMTTGSTTYALRLRRLRQHDQRDHQPALRMGPRQPARHVPRSDPAGPNRPSTPNTAMTAQASASSRLIRKHGGQLSRDHVHRRPLRAAHAHQCQWHRPATTRVHVVDGASRVAIIRAGPARPRRRVPAGRLPPRRPPRQQHRHPRRLRRLRQP